MSFDDTSLIFVSAAWVSSSVLELLGGNTSSECGLDQVTSEAVDLNNNYNKAWLGARSNNASVEVVTVAERGSA